MHLYSGVYVQCDHVFFPVGKRDVQYGALRTVSTRRAKPKTTATLLAGCAGGWILEVRRVGWVCTDGVHDVIKLECARQHVS